MGRTAMASEEAKALVKVTKKWNDAFIVLQSFLLPSFEFDGMVLNVCVGHSFSGLMFAEVRCHCVSLSCAGPGDIVSCLCAGLGALYWTGQAQHYHVFLFCYKRLILAWIWVAWTVSLQIFWRCKIPSRLSREAAGLLLSEGPAVLDRAVTWIFVAKHFHIACRLMFGLCPLNHFSGGAANLFDSCMPLTR